MRASQAGNVCMISNHFHVIGNENSIIWLH